MRRYSGWTLAAAVIASGLATLRPQPALAEGGAAWVVLPLTSSGIDPTAAATFSGLLRSELGRTISAPFVAAPASPCADIGCAVAAARVVQARFVVWGDASALGAKIIVSVSVVDATRNAVLSSQRMTAPRVEELDAVAVQLARAIAEGTSVDTVATPSPAPAPQPRVAPPTAPPYARLPSAGGVPPAATPPGTAPREAPTYAPVPAQQSEVPASTDATLGFLGRIGAFIPLGKGYAGNPGGGMAFDVGWWIESGNLAFEPRLGVRFDAVVKSEAAYAEVPIDLGAFFLTSTGDVAPFIGGGVGARYVWERRVSKLTVGAVLPAQTDIQREGDAWGVGLYGRLGLLIRAQNRGRTKSKISLLAEYGAAFVTVNGYSTPQSVVLAANAVF
jgi:hypothetical protein